MASGTAHGTAPGEATSLRQAATTDDPDLLAALAGSNDLRLVCLVASNAATAAPVVARLVDHPELCVRRSVSRRADLAPDQIRRLALDQAGPVRRATHRNHPVDLETLVELRRRGWSTRATEARLAGLLADPSVTARLLADEKLAPWAVGGVMDDDTARRVFPERAVWLRRLLAAHCEVTPAGRLAISRDPDRIVQEAIVRSPAVGDRERRRLVRRGGVWAAAALVAADPSLVRVARRRRHPVVRRRCAELERNRIRLWWWGLRPSWNVAIALARNPRLDARMQRRLMRRQVSWTVAATIAARPDIASMADAVGTAPQVQFELARNPETPAEIIDYLRRSRDPYIRGLAWIHPHTPTTSIRSLIADPDQPAWVVRRAAARTDVPEAERETALAWISLGGAKGDPLFDPVTCTGHPDPSQPGHLSYREEVRRNGVDSVLWRARALVGQEASRLGHHRLFDLARDTHPAVRRTAAQYLLADTLDELRWDEDPSVSLAAEATASRDDVRTIATPPPRDTSWGRRIVWILPLVLLAGVRAFIEPSGSSEPAFPPRWTSPPADAAPAAAGPREMVVVGPGEMMSRYPGSLLDFCDVAEVQVSLRSEGGLLLTFDVTGDVARTIRVDDLNSVFVDVGGHEVVRLPTFDDAMPVDTITITSPGSALYPTPIELTVVRSELRIEGEGCE